MKRIVERNVTRADVAPMFGRSGTAIAARSLLYVRLGMPTSDKPSDDGKVTVRWCYLTPRGYAELRDYWWNPPGEWSIGADSKGAALWLCAYLRAQGIPAAAQTPSMVQLLGRVFDKTP